MATRMQQRRGTAAQWISTNSGNGPILEAGEIGFESDTGKFKIGDGTNHWVNLAYFADVDALGTALDGDFVEITDIGAVSGVAGLDANKNLLVPGASIIVEGVTNNEFETTLTVVDPTAIGAAWAGHGAPGNRWTVFTSPCLDHAILLTKTSPEP